VHSSSSLAEVEAKELDSAKQLFSQVGRSAHHTLTEHPDLPKRRKIRLFELFPTANGVPAMLETRRSRKGMPHKATSSLPFPASPRLV
jgi:hypothetical protein